MDELDDVSESVERNLAIGSQTLNHRVLNVFKEISKHESLDTEYWTYGFNSDLILNRLANFSNADWTELEADLIYWKTHHLEILSSILSLENEEHHIAETIIAQRSYLYGCILTIVDLHTAVELMIANFDFLRRGEPKPDSLLKKLSLLLNRVDATPHAVGNHFDAYIGRISFDYLKSVMAEISQHVN